MKIGWIGTGVMGRSMAGHVQAAGHELLVHNRSKTKAEELVKKGAIWCDSAAEVAATSEILFTMVGLPSDVEETYLGKNGVLSGKGSCRILVDMTTSRPSLAQIIGQEAAKKGMESLDAPVSGGDIGARCQLGHYGWRGKGSLWRGLSCFSSWEEHFYMALWQDSIPKCATRSSLRAR
jgi:3-hydroxyisobutyrate dehydrogenase